MLTEEDILRNRLKITHTKSLSKTLDIPYQPLLKFRNGGDIKHSHYIKLKDFFQSLDKGAVNQPEK